MTFSLNESAKEMASPRVSGGHGSIGLQEECREPRTGEGRGRLTYLTFSSTPLVFEKPPAPPASEMNACRVTVVGTDVRGLFQQENRPQRHFEATLGADKKFKTTAIVGGGNKMDVVGSLKEGAATIMLDGYCLFEGPLKKK